MFDLKWAVWVQWPPTTGPAGKHYAAGQGVVEQHRRKGPAERAALRRKRQSPRNTYVVAPVGVTPDLEA